MRLSCPNCSTEYEVPDAALVGRSRKLHCTHCGTDWRSVPLSPDLVPMTDAEPARVETDQKQTQTSPAPATDPALPLFLTSGDDGGALPLNPDGTSAGRDNSFAELVDAVRSNTLEYEPEPPPRRPAVNISSMPLVVTLVVLLLAGLGALAFLTHLI